MRPARGQRAARSRARTRWPASPNARPRSASERPGVRPSNQGSGLPRSAPQCGRARDPAFRRPATAPPRIRRHLRSRSASRAADSFARAASAAARRQSPPPGASAPRSPPCGTSGYRLLPGVLPCKRACPPVLAFNIHQNARRCAPRRLRTASSRGGGGSPALMPSIWLAVIVSGVRLPVLAVVGPAVRLVLLAVLVVILEGAERGADVRQDRLARTGIQRAEPRTVRRREPLRCVDAQGDVARRAAELEPSLVLKLRLQRRGKREG